MFSSDYGRSSNILICGYYLLRSSRRCSSALEERRSGSSSVRSCSTCECVSVSNAYRKHRQRLTAGFVTSTDRCCSPYPDDLARSGLYAHPTTLCWAVARILPLPSAYGTRRLAGTRREASPFRQNERPIQSSPARPSLGRDPRSLAREVRRGRKADAAGVRTAS